MMRVPVNSLGKMYRTCKRNIHIREFRRMIATLFPICPIARPYHSPTPQKSSISLDDSEKNAKSSISPDDMSSSRCCRCLSRNTEMHCNRQQMTMRCSTGISHMEVSSTSHSSPWIPSGSATTKTFDTATSSTGCSSRTHSPDCTICVHGSQGTKNSGTK